MKTTKRAKCPSCLPDSKGAIFSLWGSNEWKCNNCGHLLPRRINNPIIKITDSQQKVLDVLTKFGWSLETKFIGRSVWVVGEKDRGSPGLNLFVGNRVYGSIGVCGKFRLKLQRLGEDKEIKDDIDMEVYLK